MKKIVASQVEYGTISPLEIDLPETKPVLPDATYERRLRALLVRRLRFFE